MNIWICNPYDPLPGEGLGELRYARLAEALGAQEHCVTWWSTDWSHTRKRRRQQRRYAPSELDGSLAVGLSVACPLAGRPDQDQTDSSPDGASALGKRARHDDSGASPPGRLELVLIPVPAYQKNISWARVRSHRAYAAGILKQAEGHAAAFGQPDVILFSVPPMEAGAVALQLGRKYGAKVVLDVMDAWPEALLLAAAKTKGKWPMANAGLRCVGRVVLWPYSRLMRRYCRESDAICAQSATFADYARQQGAVVEPEVFYLGGPPVAGEAVRPAEERGEAQPLHLVYLGSMGRVYDLATVLEAVSRLQAEGLAVRLSLIGEGEQLPQLKAQAQALGITGTVRFCGYVQQGAALADILSSADAGLVAMWPESKVAVPYKVGDYLAYGLAVLNTLPGELAQAIERADCGRCYAAGDAASLVEAVAGWVKHPERLRAQRRHARQLYEAKFDPNVIYPAMGEWAARPRDSPD